MDDTPVYSVRETDAPRRAVHSRAPAIVTEEPEAPLPKIKTARSGWWERFGQNPFVRLLAYYVILIVVVSLLIGYVPLVREAFVAPVSLPGIGDGAALLGGQPRAGPTDFPGTLRITLDEMLERIGTTALVVIGALALVLPVAWVYMYTKRLRYDPALVRSVIILPIVVAGIALVVKNSIALAFALAGIVAAVRFRNTLKDPRDAVYIFLAIAVGLSAGVQALDIALITSMGFNLVVLLLWRYNVGSIYGGRYGQTGILSVGESALLVAQAPGKQREIRKALLDEAEEMKTDGILLIHAEEPDRARMTAQEVFSDVAKDWRLARIVPRGGELSTLEYLVRLKKKTDPAELVGALDERWSTQVVAAEYIPFRKRKRKREKDEKDGDRK